MSKTKNTLEANYEKAVERVEKLKKELWDARKARGEALKKLELEQTKEG